MILVKNVTKNEAVIGLVRPKHSVSAYIGYLTDLNSKIEKRKIRISRQNRPWHTFTLKPLIPGSKYELSIISVEASLKSESKTVQFMTVPKEVEKLR